ncbi:hypothetical protein ENBRE01_0135 [Enteropsectra breve]|nr:hypothetical protein ENBRE01_0135 [Enteropsectra breve]
MKQSQNVSVRKILMDCFKANRILLILLLVCYILVILNGMANTSLKSNSEDFKKECENLQSTDASQASKSTDEMIGMLYYWLANILTHYFLSNVIELLRGMIVITILMHTAQGAVKDTLSMENASFHKTGIGKSQETIQRSSWAFYDCSACVLIDIPRDIIYLGMATFYINKYLDSDIVKWYFPLVFFCVLLVCGVAYIVNKFEAKIISMYLKSIPVISNMFCNYDIVQSFNREDHEVSQYKNSLSDFNNQINRYYLVKEILSFLVKMLLMVPHIIVFYLIVTKRIVLKNTRLYNDHFMTYKRLFLSIRDLSFSFIKKKNEANTRVEIIKKADNKEGLEINEFNNSIVLDNAELYADTHLLSSNLNVQINKGEKIAITGVNGAGKSTFLKTLLRFNKNGGRLLIDDIPIENISKVAMRNLISYVPQDHSIMNNTVIYNLAYGQTVYNEEEIFRLCEHYGLHEFFKNLVDGYNTQCGENGKNLSGGQKQRVNFMRAIIKNAPILILDEPTANVDKVSENEIIDTIINKTDDKTVLVIVHNMDLLKKFKKILYFKKTGIETFTDFNDVVAMNKCS